MISPRCSTVTQSADVGDDGEIVLDHQHGAVARRLDVIELGDRADILVPHAGHRLVEQQHLGIERQRRGDLQHPLAAIGKVGGEAVRWRRPGRPCRSSSSARGVSRSRADSERQNWLASPFGRCSATRTLSSTVRCGKIAEIWNERTTPIRATLAGVARVMSWPSQRDRAGGRLQEFGQQVEDGGLAGAVRADQRMDHAVADVEIDIADRHEARKVAPQAAGG